MPAPKPTVKLKAKLPKETGDCNGLTRHATRALRDNPGTFLAIVRLSVGETVRYADGRKVPVFEIEQIEAVDKPADIDQVERLAEAYYILRNGERGHQDPIEGLDVNAGNRPDQAG